MDILKYNMQLRVLREKGGLMFFTVERPARLYQGTILLMPAKNDRQKRAVYIKEFAKKSDIIHDTGGLNETE